MRLEPIINPEEVQRIRRTIAKMAHSEEEVHSILQMLQDTNWTSFFIRQSPFKKCYRCNCLLTPSLDSGDGLCWDCAAFICALCKKPTLKDDYYGYSCRVICEDCLIRRNIKVTWQALEAGKVNGNGIRAWKQGFTGDLSFRQWLTTLEDFNWLCAYCQQSPYEVLEHFIPITKEGDTIPSNCVPSCNACNYAKSRRHPNDVDAIEWMSLYRVKKYLSTRI